MRAGNPPFSKEKRTAALPLYTPEERLRRDSTPWTLVQGLLAPVQFAVFLVSLVLVLRDLQTGQGAAAAACSELAPVLARFREGLGTADLIAAHTLLGSLGHTPPGPSDY